MRKTLLLTLFTIVVSTAVLAQDPTIHPEPGAVSWCPSWDTDYEVWTTGAVQDNCTYKWTITNGTIQGDDNKQTVTVKWDNTTSKGSLTVKLTNCTAATNTTVTSEYIIRSLTGKSLQNPMATSLLPYCSTAPIVVKVDPITIPNTGAGSPVNTQYADGYEWTIPSGWTANGTAGPTTISTTENFATLVPNNGCAGGSVTAKAYINSCIIGKIYSNTTSAINIGRKGTFTVTPQSGYVGSSCGDVSPVTFTATYSYVDNSGQTITQSLPCASKYKWNFPSGWHGPNGETGSAESTSNTISLTPSGTPSDAGNVTLSTLDFDCGTITPSKSYSVIYTPPSPAIAGNTLICANQGAAFTVTNLPIGGAITSWVSSNSSIMPIDGTGYATNTTNLYNGPIWITANLSAPCPINPVTLPLWLGKPSISYSIDGSSGPYPLCSAGNIPYTSFQDHYIDATVGGTTSTFNYVMNAPVGVVNGGNYGSRGYNFYPKSTSANFTITGSTSNTCGTTTQCLYFSNTSGPCIDPAINSITITNPSNVTTTWTGDCGSNYYTFTKNQWYTFTVNASAGSSISYSVSSTNATTQSISATQFKVKCSVATTSFAIHITSTTSCGSVQKCVWFSNTGAAVPIVAPPIEEESLIANENSSITAYPNPATSTLTIAIPANGHDEKSAKAYQLSLYDKFSKSVYSIQSSESVIEIPVQHLPEGVYYLNIIHKDKVIRKQVYIKK